MSDPFPSDQHYGAGDCPVADSTHANVTRFGVLMIRELQANAAKGDWEKWHPTLPELIAQINDQVVGLAAAIVTGDKACVAENAADLANQAMKAWEEFGQ